MTNGLLHRSAPPIIYGLGVLAANHRRHKWPWRRDRLFESETFTAGLHDVSKSENAV